MDSKKEIQHVYLVGAKSLGAYGGYETFVYKLTEYHQNKENIKYHVACKANGDGCMDESKFEGVTKINDHEFEFHNAHCFKIDVPQIGSAQAIYYDVAALKACCEHKFSIGVSENGALVGVAICGRPVARRLDDGYTLEVNRLCTDGTPNVCSILYAAAYRAARAMGYNRVVTYILDTENGASLKAAGYTCEGRAGGLEWNGAKAPKQADQYPRQMKTRWVKKKEGLHGS